jgi:hypothetical protein
MQGIGVGLAGSPIMANLQERRGWFHLQFCYQSRQYRHAFDTQVLKEAEAIRGTVDRVLIRIKNRKLPGSGPNDDVVKFFMVGGKPVEAPVPVKVPLTAQDLRDQIPASSRERRNRGGAEHDREGRHDSCRQTL